MKNNTPLILVLLLYSFIINAQDLTCADFHNGKFYIPSSEELKKFTIIKKDSIKEFTLQLDSTVTKTVIERKGETQTEWTNGIGNGEPAYEVIEWIDDCTYRLTYDPSKMEMDAKEKWINENNGIVVSMIKIESNCLFYRAVMLTNNDEEITQQGVICKD